ncbi:response regulator transcription factor [Novosphingobium terrae]|uniref:response regulator transcription factor n=1 Tax=Novosphingobium terrae TaxID=2726189 RepID=UPI00197D605D|nr:response regulator transcription factor [Novosphingobium terrae]
MQEGAEQQGESILVADDDEDIRGMMAQRFGREHFHVSTAGNVAQVRQIVGSQQIDLIVLDLNLPDGDGLALCAQLRAQGFAGAIIMVTARDSTSDRVLGLELGADDYLTKPFDFRELLARVRKLLHRFAAMPAGRPRGARYAIFGEWRLDLIGRRLVAPDGHLVILSSAEFRLLERFIEMPNRVLSKELLLPERKATVAVDRSIVLQISRLRQKLVAAGADEGLIVTVRNEGYVFASTVSFEWA